MFSLFPTVNAKWGYSHVSESSNKLCFRSIPGNGCAEGSGPILFNQIVFFDPLFHLLFFVHCLVLISTEFSHIPKYIYLFTASLEAQLSPIFFKP